MLTFYPLFGATHFLSIKIVSQKRRKSNLFRPNTAPKTPLILRGVLVEISLELRLISTTAWERLRSQATGRLISAPGGNQSHRGTQFDNRPPPKIKGGGQAPLGLARLDNRRARPGGAVNGGALVRRSSRPLTAPTGFAIHLKKCVVFYSIS